MQTALFLLFVWCVLHYYVAIWDGLYGSRSLCICMVCTFGDVYANSIIIFMLVADYDKSAPFFAFTVLQW